MSTSVREATYCTPSLLLWALMTYNLYAGFSSVSCVFECVFYTMYYYVCILCSVCTLRSCLVTAGSSVQSGGWRLSCSCALLKIQLVISLLLSNIFKGEGQ